MPLARPFRYDVGLLRTERTTNRIACGEDGVLWNEDHLIAALCDGMGALRVQDSGMLDLERFEGLLERGSSYFRSRLIDAFYGLVGHGHSTFVGLQLPKDSTQYARMIYAGDSSCFLLRGNELIQLSFPEHNLWSGIAHQFPEELRDAKSYRDIVNFVRAQANPTQSLAHLIELMKKSLLEAEGSWSHKKNALSNLVTATQACDANIEKYSKYLFSGISVLESRVYCHLHLDKSALGSEEAIQEKVAQRRKEYFDVLGEGFVFKVEPGDRFLLCSDGVSDVVHKKDLQRVLSIRKNAWVSVQMIMTLAQEHQHLKADDRSAIVVDVS